MKADLPLNLEVNLTSIFKVKVGVSEIHGVGLFTVLPLLEDEIVCDIKNLVRYPKTRLVALPEPIRKIMASVPILFAERNEILVPTTNDQPMYWFMNHSIKPNVYFDGDSFRALKEIPAGTELTYNYATLDYHEEFLF